MYLCCPFFIINLTSRLNKKMKNIKFNSIRYMSPPPLGLCTHVHTVPPQVVSTELNLYSLLAP